MTDKVFATQWVTSINNESNNSIASADSADQPNADRWTLQRLLDWTTNYFKESGFDNPRLDSEVLLAEALDCQRIELYTRFDEEPPESVKGKFRDWVARHAEGEPVAQLVGYKEFFSIKFKVTPDVLIPRPETEHLVTKALDAIKLMGGREKPITVVDVGTGSGCVAVAIAKHADNVSIVASDISEAALAVARENAELHGVTGIRFVVSDLLEAVPEPAHFDLIVSNPPYIGLDEKSDLDRSVVDFEPHLALFATGPKGTETIERLVQQAAERLAPGGWLMFELSPMIAEACQRIVEATAGLRFDAWIKDLAGHRRIAIAQKS